MNILITGAGKGIGFETVKQLLHSGEHQLIAISRNLKSLRAISHPNLLLVQADLGMPGMANEISSALEDEIEQLDVVIHNAGQLVNKAFVDQTEDDFELQFNINVKAVFLLTQALIPFLHPGSHIVTISSMGGFQSSKKYPGLSLYSASKGALAVLTECLAEELGTAGISVNCLALGAVQTEMLKKAFPKYKAPLKASEMAAFISDFALNGHRTCNGRIIPVTLSNP